MSDDREQRVLFSQADAQLERYVSEDQFYSDLLIRLLLEPGIVIPDIFFLISEHVRNDVRRISKRNWIARGLSEGLISPAFRDPNMNFESMYDSLITKAKIRGARSDGSGTAKLLRRVASPSRLEWAPMMGVKYRLEIEKQLRQEVDELSDASDIERILWDQSTRLRNNMIDKALNSATDLEVDGLRRGELLVALAQIAGAPETVDIGRILQYVPKSEKPVYRATALWVSEVYHLAHADALGEVRENPLVRPSFPVMMEPGSSILAKDVSAERVRNRAEESGEVRSTVVDWPTMDALLAAGPDKIIAVRKGDKGKQFIDSLVEFRKSPDNADSWDLLKTDLEAYAYDLCRAAGDPTGTKLRTAATLTTKVSGAVTALTGLGVPDSVGKIISATGVAVMAVAEVAVQRPIGSQKKKISVRGSDLVQIDAPAMLRQLKRRA